MDNKEEDEKEREADAALLRRCWWCGFASVSGDVVGATRGARTGTWRCRRGRAGGRGDAASTGAAAAAPSSSSSSATHSRSSNPCDVEEEKQRSLLLPPDPNWTSRPLLWLLALWLLWLLLLLLSVPPRRWLAPLVYVHGLIEWE